MGTLGGALKRKEKLSARLGDILSLLYLCSATLKRYEAEGRQAADAPLMHWAMWDAMFKAQSAFEGVISQFPESRRRRAAARGIVFPLGRPYVVPSDELGHEVATLLIEPSATRDRLTAAMYICRATRTIRSAPSSARWTATMAAEPIEAKIAQRDQGRPPRRHCRAGCGRRCARALAPSRAGIITRTRRALLAAHRELVDARHCASTTSTATSARPLAARSRRSTGCAAAAHEQRTPSRGTASTSAMNGHDRARLHRRRRAHAVPQGAQQARALRRVRSRDRGGPRAAAAPDVRADAARRGDPRLRGAVGRRSEHRPRRRLAHGLRAEGAGLDRDAQLRVGHAGDRLGDQQHSRRAARTSCSPAASMRCRARRCSSPTRWSCGCRNWYAAKTRGTARGAAREVPPAATSRRSSRS